MRLALNASQSSLRMADRAFNDRDRLAAGIVEASNGLKAMEECMRDSVSLDIEYASVYILPCGHMVTAETLQRNRTTTLNQQQQTLLRKNDGCKICPPSCYECRREYGRMDLCYPCFNMNNVVNAYKKVRMTVRDLMTLQPPPPLPEKEGDWKEEDWILRGVPPPPHLPYPAAPTPRYSPPQASASVAAAAAVQGGSDTPAYYVSGDGGYDTPSYDDPSESVAAGGAYSPSYAPSNVPAPVAPFIPMLPSHMHSLHEHVASTAEAVRAAADAMSNVRSDSATVGRLQEDARRAVGRLVSILRGDFTFAS